MRGLNGPILLPPRRKPPIKTPGAVNTAACCSTPSRNRELLRHFALAAIADALCAGGSHRGGARGSVGTAGAAAVAHDSTGCSGGCQDHAVLYVVCCALSLREHRLFLRCFGESNDSNPSATSAAAAGNCAAVTPHRAMADPTRSDPKHRHSNRVEERNRGEAAGRSGRSGQAHVRRVEETLQVHDCGID